MTDTSWNQVRPVTLQEFWDELKGQGVTEIEDVALVCPMCRCVQSARDLIAAGAGADIDAVEKYLGYSCVGRWLNSPPPRREPDGDFCDWTLGGLLTLHRLEVIMPDGKAHPRFEPATPEQAQAHAAMHARHRASRLAE